MRTLVGIDSLSRSLERQARSSAGFLIAAANF